MRGGHAGRTLGAEARHHVTKSKRETERIQQHSTRWHQHSMSHAWHDRVHVVTLAITARMPHSLPYTWYARPLAQASG
jgi:hypothetical protein